ncbi:5-oxoprolinase subunit B family protein [Williamsia sterculiae]|uniref:Sensor histidine kinase inhibitor, KipI family n=1 Tax=Williamsia sterculiae TaxID=1344003 RepID=A0A1N7DE33_9NOCA|nr:carboxyltransferase domain-containing protein [Williamsia sterculiae]SIR74119.1 sensor histidine kinase inhibitor, KipI family [Williamsia sterculiae]
MRALWAGRDAVLLDFADEADPATATLHAEAVLRTRMRHGDLAGVDDLIPTAQSLLVQATPGSGLDTLALRRVTRTLADDGDQKVSATTTSTEDTVVVPTVYDGEDLAEVAEKLAVGVDEVIAAHTETAWRVQFMGFAPGFGYLTCDPDSPAAQLVSIPRRRRSRPRVPAGSVAVAAGYTAVYPRQSPGGWQLIGHTDMRMWDVGWADPAVLTAGTAVRFEAAG